MSTIKADAVTTKSDNTDLVVTGGGSGVPDIEASFKVGGTAGVPMASIRTTSGTASSSTFLRGDGTWNAAGGAWTLIGTQTASTSASLIQTGLDFTTYATHVICLSNVTPVSDGEGIDLRVGDSSGLDSGGSDYSYHRQYQSPAATTYVSAVSTGAAGLRFGYQNGTGNAAGEGANATFFITAGGGRPTIYGTWASQSNSSVVSGGTLIGQREAVLTCDRVGFVMTSGNVLAGRMTVWGIAHA